MSVATFHLSIMFGDPRFALGPVFADYTGRGSLGVDFFFVLSGFIIMLAHQRDVGVPGQLGTYLAKRAIRIYPVYWIFTALVILGASITGGVNRPPDHPGDLLSMVSLVRFTSYAMPLAPSWTLFHEILFYAFFGLLIVRRSLGVFLMGIWFLMVAAHFQYAGEYDLNFLSDFLSLHNMSFLFGMAAFGLTTRVPGRLGRWALPAGAGLLVLLLLAARSELTAPLQLGCSLAFMLIIVGAVAFEQEHGLPEIPLLGMIGDASYSLYLSHESIASALLKIATKLGAGRMVDPRLIYVAILVAMVLFALIFYRCVERPLLAMARRHLKGTRQPSGQPPMAAA